MGNKEDFKFNIQLFAEEGQEPVSQQANQESTAPQGTPNQEPINTQVEEPDWRLDEDGNVQLNPKIFDDMVRQPVSPVEQKVEQTEPVAQEPTPEEPVKYTVKIDGVEKQVTLDELQKGYMMNSDYTKKTMELADQRKQLEQQLSSLNNPQPQQQQQVQQPPENNPKAYYEKLSKYATQRVAQNLGEDFDELNPVHNAALADEIATLRAAMYERTVAQRNISNLYQKYAQDPNIKEIDSFAAQQLQNLPYGQAIKVQQALQSYNIPVIDAFMGACRDQYYRAKGFVPTNEIPNKQQIAQSQVSTPPVAKQNPPFVESTGVSQQKPAQTKTSLDYSKIGGLSMDKQAELVAKLGLG
jgi:hypothetical protein